MSGNRNDNGSTINEAFHGRNGAPRHQSNKHQIIKPSDPDFEEIRAVTTENRDFTTKIWADLAETVCQVNRQLIAIIRRSRSFQIR